MFVPYAEKGLNGLITSGIVSSGTVSIFPEKDM